MQCPCQSQKTFEQCCHPIISGKKAKTAEELLRARYTAFSQVEMDFIESSHDPKTRKDNDMTANLQWAKETSWLGLEIISVKDGLEADTSAQIEFKVKYKANEQEGIHHESSQFSKKNGVWFFTNGKVVGQESIRRDSPKVGRNEPCPCGSGKKYKKCCAT